MTIQRTHLTCSVMMLAAAAGAQQTAFKPWSISGGWNYLPTSGQSHAVNSSGWQALVGYHIKPQGQGMGSGDSAVEFSWNRNQGNGNRLDIWALEVTGRYPFSNNPREKNVPYYGFGVGGALTQFVAGQAPGGSSGAILSPRSVGVRGIGTGSGSDSRINFAGKALLGYNLASDFFVEAAYNYYGSIEGTTLDSITVSVGIRF